MMLRYVNNGSGNGLVSSGNRLIPEPMLTKFYDVIWHHKQTITQIPTYAAFMSLNWVIIGLGNGLSLFGTQLLSDPIMTSHRSQPK